jgi:predicted small lipoprotein YifL
MKEAILPITISLLILSLAGCSLLPPLGTLPSSTPAAPSIPTSGYEPQLEDDKQKRDQVFLDVENSSVVTMESYPVQVSVVLNGNLSDPCHQLRVVVTPANAQNEINLDIYSVVDPSVACITVLKPFSATIPLGNYAGGHYMVYVNGQLLGEFDA